MFIYCNTFPVNQLEQLLGQKCKPRVASEDHEMKEEREIEDESMEEESETDDPVLTKQSKSEALKKKSDRSRMIVQDVPPTTPCNDYLILNGYLGCCVSCDVLHTEYLLVIVCL